MPTPRIERETTIVFNEEEGEAMLWSASPLFQRKMERLGIEHYKSSGRDGLPVDESRYYRIPKSWVKIRLPKIMTEEQRAMAAERARTLFRKKTTEAPTEDRVLGRFDPELHEKFDPIVSPEGQTS